MYQFYYADQTQGLIRKECQKNIHDYFHITAIRPTMWEEHCLECAAPSCFGTCVHYTPRSDGRCKRFENGLMTFSDEKACCGQGVRVKFRPWGNMMTIIFPAMLNLQDYQALCEKNDGLGNTLGAVAKSPLPQAVRWQSIRIPEFLRRRSLRKLTGGGNTADAFLFHGYSYHTDRYNLILEIYDDHTPVYKTAIEIQPGENLALVTDLPNACSTANYLVKVYPENNLEAELDILWCDFVQGTPLSLPQPDATVKCVAWDLDQTLWDGILIETNDPNNLSLRPGVRELLEALDQRGILQSLVSKNDHEAAMEQLERLGISHYFLYPQIHWNPKSSSIRQIAEDLNIGIDAVAMIDDSIFERQQVQSVYPQVRTYDIYDLPGLLDREEFCVSVTAESRSRRAMYQAEAQRKALIQGSQTDITDFIRKCNLSIRVFQPATEEEIFRCYELTARTNQLNMSGNKYTPDEFSAVLAREGHTNFAFSCADNFGSYGIVGFGQYRIENKALVFTEFAMSCRVAGKFVESALFHHLLEVENAKSGEFTVQKTKKNNLLRNSLESIGFTAMHQDDRQISYHFTSDLRNSNIVKTEGAFHV